MYNASIHFELATFVARNTIYRYYTQQLVVVVELLCVVGAILFFTFWCGCLYVRYTYVFVLCYLCIVFVLVADFAVTAVPGT